VLRKVDPANRKVIYHRGPPSVTLGWASAWADGQHNLPDQLRLLVPLRRGERQSGGPLLMSSPLQLPALTRLKYIRGGPCRGRRGGPTRTRGGWRSFLWKGELCRRARSTLRLIIDRHGLALSGSAHALRKGSITQRGFDRSGHSGHSRSSGVLLSKLASEGGVYASKTASNSGNFSLSADAVHLPATAPIATRDVPPVLLGNSRADDSAVKTRSGRWRFWAALETIPALGQSRSASREQSGNP